MAVFVFTFYSCILLASSAVFIDANDVAENQQLAARYVQHFI